MHIFLLEDDLALQKGIALKLTKQNNQVTCCGSLAEAKQCVFSTIDMAIIDINLPDGSGLDVCRDLRIKMPQIHILILTANDTEVDTIVGYEMGADDYMAKPFSLSVLLSKISAVQRRLLRPEKNNGLTLYDLRQTVVIGGKTIQLTPKEWRLLHLLYKNAGQILTKEQMLEAIWDIDGDFIDENTLAVNISRLRSKIEIDLTTQGLIENIRGVGYRLNGDKL